MARHEHHNLRRAYENHTSNLQYKQYSRAGKGVFYNGGKNTTVFQYRHIRVILNDRGLFNSRATL